MQIGSEVSDYYCAWRCLSAATVQVLWDKKEKTIVNNESADILRMLNSEFNQFAKNKTLDLYPTALRPEIDSVNEWVGKSINSGVYKVGGASNQVEYDKVR